MCEAAVRLAKTAGYYSTGTVEFIVDQEGNFYFIELNSRIQVEHPVTEMVTGIDLITEQLRVAAGEKLSITQDQVRVQGHAIEIRVNAENPARNFAPCPGEITLYCPPGGPGIRVDSHVYTGYRIPPYYDSMVAKLIVHGRDREEALARASRALREYVVEGVHTTIEFAEFILNREDVIRGDYHTGYLEHVLETSWFEPNE